MSREIKFRAWDKQNKKFLSDSQNPSFIIIWWSGDVFPMYQTTDMDWAYHDYADLEDEKFWENIELLQFTGFYDEDWNEIYEGDIVKINHPYDTTNDFTDAIGVVFWRDEEGGFYHTNNNGRPPKKIWDYVRVIWNIYENPNLIDKDQ